MGERSKRELCEDPNPRPAGRPERAGRPEETPPKKAPSVNFYLRSPDSAAIVTDN